MKYLSITAAIAFTLSLLSPAAAQAPAKTVFEKAIGPTPMATLFEDRVQVENSRFISLWLQNTALKETDFKDAASFIIQSKDDPNYAPDKNVNPVSVSARSRVSRLSNRKNMMIKTTAVFLELPQPMRSGCHYSVSASLQGLPASAVLFDDKRTVSDNIKVNQVGYLPGLEKYAYLGQYAGTRGGLPFSVDRFELLTLDGESAFQGEPTRRSVNEQYVGQELYELDFTAFNKPGTYRLYVPGVGLSYPFDIGPTALNSAYVNLMRGHLIQRCGGDIPHTLTRHHHEACHVDDAYVDPGALTSPFVKQPKDKVGKVPVHKPVHEKQQRPATRGHHDAGDYGKYTSNGCNFIVLGLQMMRLYPEKFQEDNLGMPNSGNQIPDVLEELKWELDWVENMQDDDGGVFGVIRPNTGGYENTVPPPTNKRWMFPKDTNYTAAYAAALAHASTHPQIKKYYPEDAKRYLEKSRKAWAWLEVNKDYTEYWHYGALFKDKDELCWAAVELYAATGDEKFHDYFLKNFNPLEARWGWQHLVECVGHAARRYAFMTDQKTDSVMKERCREVILKTADTLVVNTEQFPYRIAMAPESLRHGRYGWIFPSATWSYDLLTANALKPSADYTKAALRQLDYELGANPFGYSLYTGIGYKRNTEIVSNASSFDAIKEPTPGIPNGIGSEGIYWLNQYGRAAGEGMFPQNWPLVNRWYDGFNVNTEFTVDMMIKSTMTMGFFAGKSDVTPTQPKVTIHTQTVTGQAPLTINFSSTVTGGTGRPKFYFWDFDDENFSSDPSPTHVFKDDGKEYNVALTVLDENGFLGYHTVKVVCKRTKPGYSGTPAGAGPSTVLYLPFDADMNDASSGKLKPVVVVGRSGAPEMRLEDSPQWMDQPAGKCLVMFGREQLKFSIPNARVNKPDQIVTITAKLYVEEFAGWGWDGNPTSLGLNHHDDSCLNIRQDKWDRAGGPKAAAGKAEIISAVKLTQLWPKNKWVEVKLVFNGVNESELYIDGQKVSQAKGVAIHPGRSQDMTFFVGPFIGKVDDVSLTVSRP